MSEKDKHVSETMRITTTTGREHLARSRKSGGENSQQKELVSLKDKVFSCLVKFFAV